MADIPADCLFQDPGIFHFKAEFYFDAQFTSLAFEVKSVDNPEHWLVNGIPLSAGGLVADLDTCYVIRYDPPIATLVELGATDMTHFTRISAVLDKLTGF